MIGKSNAFQTISNHGLGGVFAAISGQEAGRKRKRNGCPLDNCVHLIRNGLGYKNKYSEFIRSDFPGELMYSQLPY